MLPISGSGLGPGGKGAGRRLETARLASQRKAPARHKQATNESILYLHEESEGRWVGELLRQAAYLHDLSNGYVLLLRAAATSNLIKTKAVPVTINRVRFPQVATHSSYVYY